MCECEDAAHHQPGARQQHNREPHLRNNQRSAKLSVTETTLHPVACVFEPRLQVLARSMERWRKATENRSEHGHAQRKGQNCQIQPNRGLIGDPLMQRNRSDNPFQAAERQQTANRSARQGQHKAFNQQLADQLSARRTNRSAHGNFLFPGGGPRQQQVCHVAASDQQQHRHRPNQRV